jgi:tetratricopeptide (TPR) repeat protein
VQAADRAISIDPGLAEAYSARGHIRSSILWNWTGAQADFDRALALDPGDSFTQWRYASFLASLARLPEAIAAARRAAELDPLWPPAWTVLGWYLTDYGQYREARTALNRALEIDPEFRFAHFYLGLAALLEGEPKAAVSEFERAGDVFRLTGLALAEHDLGHGEAAKEALNELIGRHALSSAYQIAEVYSWRGETERAFDWLERAYAQRDGGLTFIKTDPFMAKLRGDPRYTAMLTKLSLSDVT